MFACIPLLLIAFLIVTIYHLGEKQRKKYLEMELTKGEGIIDSSYTDDNGYSKYYIRFCVRGETVVKRAVTVHAPQCEYNEGTQVPIGYHVDENGVITVFIDDEHLEKNKNHKPNNMLLYIALMIVGITVVYAIKTLFQN